MIVKTMVHSFFALGIVLLFTAQPLLAQKNDTMAEYQAGFYYTVKQGDTLWDLSDRFSDSPGQWPELWHQNRQLTNPHWIYPGQRIRIFQKSWIGRLIPQKTIAPEKIEVPQLEPVRTFSYSPIDSIGYIRKDPIIPSGTIIRVKDDKEMISHGDMVYITMSEGRSVSPGQRYTVYRTFKGLKDSRGRKDIGIQYYLTGIVQISEVEPRYAIGHVTHSYRTIKLNDNLLPYEPKSSEIELIESIDGLEGRIIASEEHASIIGDNTVAFIDKGIWNGIKPGQTYHIYYQDSQVLDPREGTSESLKPVNFGKLLVLHTETTTSTVLITHADKSVFPGAKIRSIVPESDL